MSNIPLISIIVPVYNVEKYLDRCISSILQQSFLDYECLLIDDGSSDNSGLICDKWKTLDIRIKVYHKQNGGLSDARNFGLKKCTGDYVTFIDSDDWVFPDYLEILYDNLLSTRADISVSLPVRFSTYNESVRFQRSSNSWKIFSQEDYFRIFFREKGNKTIHYAWGKLYRKALLDDNHFPKGILNEDVEGFFKALLNSHLIVETSRELYCYFINRNSITGSVFGDNYLSLELVWDRISAIAKARRSDLEPYCKINKERSYFTILCDSIIHGNADTDVCYAKEIDELIIKLRYSLISLLSSNIRFDRKIMMLLLAYLYQPIRFIFRVSVSLFRKVSSLTLRT